MKTTPSADPAPFLTPLLAAAWCDAAHIAPRAADRHVDCSAAGRDDDCYQIHVRGLSDAALSGALAALGAYAPGDSRGRARDAAAVILHTLRPLSHEVVYEDAGPVLVVNVLLDRDRWGELLAVRRTEELVVASTRADLDAPQRPRGASGHGVRTRMRRGRSGRDMGRMPTWCFAIAAIVVAAVALALVGALWDTPPDGLPHSYDGAPSRPPLHTHEHHHRYSERRDEHAADAPPYGAEYDRVA